MGIHTTGVYMNDAKVKQFISLAGQRPSPKLTHGTPAQRALGAQLLLSEVLEYIICGLGVTPEFNGTKITAANELSYHATGEPDSIEMLDGLADTAYTMYWNAVTFGLPLEQAFDEVCDNNLEKFVRLSSANFIEGEIPAERWGCDANVTWPSEVVKVEAIRHGEELFAVGKDKSGKVRKPSSYASINLEPLVQSAS